MNTFYELHETSILNLVPRHFSPLDCISFRVCSGICIMEGLLRLVRRFRHCGRNDTFCSCIIQAKCQANEALSQHDDDKKYSTQLSIVSDISAYVILVVPDPGLSRDTGISFVGNMIHSMRRFRYFGRNNSLSIMEANCYVQDYNLISFISIIIDVSKVSPHFSSQGCQCRSKQRSKEKVVSQSSFLPEPR